MRIVRYLLERLTNLDLTLMGRFGRRELDRSLSWLHAQRHLQGPVGTTLASNREAERTSVCLGGLEVEQSASNAATITVRPGALLGTHPSPVTETRPGTWSGREEADDYARTMCILPIASTIAPSVPLVSPTTGTEWWVVYVTPTVQALETDSARKVFNEGTGVFDSASATKVERLKATPAALRGTPDGSIPDPPAGGVPIAWIFVPSGVSNLNNAVVFDVRRLLHDDPGPNEVRGSWRCTHEGAAVAPYTEAIFQGAVTARLGGELLAARSDLPGGTGLRVGDLAEPGATWDAAASTSTPKMAWLYLAKPKGLCPRPVRRGQSPIGNSGSFLNDAVVIDGALVLSPTPPKIGGIASGDTRKSALRWDLRASAAVALPSFQRGDIAYTYAGITAQPDDTICIGFLRYSALDSGMPVIHGSLFVDEGGWAHGSAIASTTLNASGLFTVPGTTPDNASSPRTLTSSGSYGFAEVTVSGTPQTLPLVAARLLFDGATTDAVSPVKLTREDAGRTIRQGAGSSPSFQAVLERHASYPGGRYLREIQMTVAASTTFDSGSFSLLAVKLPYGEPLVT